MPRKLRRAKVCRKRSDLLPPAVAEWLERGDNPRASWVVSNLHYDRTVQPGCWTRADLRDLGYGPQLDRLIERVCARRMGGAMPGEIGRV
jgi:hypothetical protein